ncbi:hypothetical protein [Fulvimarina sp. MAC8]|uniref:hypothetical protein n=1 Tax=Fulvimarina sp. MAC8 TaxID=3162874 RepID=UPI0032EB934F
MTGLSDDIVGLLLLLRRWCVEAEEMISGQPDALFSESRIHELALTKVIEQVGEVSGRLLRRNPEFVAANSELELAPAY